MLRKMLIFVLSALVPLLAMSAPSAANAATVSAATANPATAASCPNGVAVSQFSFSPPSIPTTSTSALTLVLQDCGTRPIQGSTIWFGQYAGQNCPVLDPSPATPFTIAAGASYTLTNTYGAPGGECQPTSLTMHVNVSVNGVVGVAATATATLQFTPPCATNGIVVNQFSFNPATVGLNQTSTLTLVLQNCTNKTVQGSSSWFPQYTWPGTGRPPGCPVQDPVAFNYSMAPGATSTATLGLGNYYAGCLATGIQATADVYENGVTAPVATPTANLVITQPQPNACHVTYTPDTWQGGFTANIVIANTGSSAISNWTLTFAFPGDQQITNAWNATIAQSGTTIVAANMAYNATITPGGSQSFGFQGTWTTNNTPPSAFTINGAPCT